MRNLLQRLLDNILDFISAIFNVGIRLKYVLALLILFTGGAISLVIYLVWNITIVKELTRYKSFKLSRYMGFFFFSLCLICVTECPYQPMIFALYIFLVNI